MILGQAPQSGSEDSLPVCQSCPGNKIIWVCLWQHVMVRTCEVEICPNQKHGGVQKGYSSLFSEPISTQIYLPVVPVAGLRCLRVLPWTFHHWLRRGHQLLCPATVQRGDFPTPDSWRHRIVVPTERGGGMCLDADFLVAKIRNILG